jgi:SnoaL-like domain
MSHRHDDHLPEARPASAAGASARGATALGAVAAGAVAIGAAAIGRLAVGRATVGRLALGRAAVRRLEIEELVVHRVELREALQQPGAGGGPSTGAPAAGTPAAAPTGRRSSDAGARAAAWVAAYERAWRSPGTERLGELFAADATYSPGPFEPTVRGLDAIASFWEAERDGPGEVFTLTSEPVAAEGAVAVLRTEVVYGIPERQRYRNLWIVTFGDDGRASAFEEWPFWPEQPHAAAP